MIHMGRLPLVKMAVCESVTPQPDETSFLDGLSGRELAIAKAYIDIEMAYIMFDGTKRFNGLAECYCDDWHIDFSEKYHNPDEVEPDEKFLENYAEITLDEINEFRAGLSAEDEDALYNLAKKAAIARGGYAATEYGINYHLENA